MALTFWQRVCLGVAGGILITCGFWLFTLLEGNSRFFSIIPIIFGILSILFGRYG